MLWAATSQALSQEVLEVPAGALSVGLHARERRVSQQPLALRKHSVILAGSEERITLSHSAENRSIFARGAVRAAEWMIGRTPGRYTMDQVLGI